MRDDDEGVLRPERGGVLEDPLTGPLSDLRAGLGTDALGLSPGAPDGELVGPVAPQVVAREPFPEPERPLAQSRVDQEVEAGRASRGSSRSRARGSGPTSTITVGSCRVSRRAAAVRACQRPTASSGMSTCPCRRASELYAVRPCRTRSSRPAVTRRCPRRSPARQRGDRSRGSPSTAARGRSTPGPRRAGRARRRRRSPPGPSGPRALPSRRIGLAPRWKSASSTASTIAPTCRSLEPEAMRKTSVSTSCSLTSSAMISSALMSEAARAAATASSIARSVAATGLLGSGSAGRAVLRQVQRRGR